jgi:hypothetical protein
LTETNDVFIADDSYEALVAEIIRRLTPDRDAVIWALAEAAGIYPARIQGPVEQHVEAA